MGAWAALWLAIWVVWRPVVMPSPLDVLSAFPDLWLRDGLGQELVSSLVVNLEALAISTAIALPLAYLSRVPAVMPIAKGLSLLRFLSPVVFFVLLVFLLESGHQVKIGMLVLGEAFFLLTTMVGVVLNIPDAKFDDARTLRMSEWKATYYVVIRGTLPQALEAIRDNAAIGWSFAMMVEGIVRSEGGVGVMLLNQQKYQNFGPFYAASLAILATGLFQDCALGWLRRTVCPYVALGGQK